MSIADIERASLLPKATAYRLTRQLVTLQLLQTEPGTNRHTEGPRLRALSWNALNASTSRSIRRSIMAGLADEIGETCYIGALIDGRIHVIDSIVSSHVLGVNIATGMQLPIHATAVGKLMMAELPLRDRGALLGAHALTSVAAGTITQTSRLDQALAAIARTGYATEDQEHADGVVGVAVPIRFPGGRLLGGLALAAPAMRLDLAGARTHVSKLQDVAERLAASFGVG